MFNIHDVAWDGLSFMLIGPPIIWLILRLWFGASSALGF
jgi:hypothetical protein